MTIAAIGSIAAGITPVVGAANGAAGTAAAGAANGGSFADAVRKGLEAVSQQEFTANALTEALASGQPVQIQDVMAATTKSQLSLDLLVQVRNKALDAYREITNMQI
jgi:flagellar hook-basal body complex protein FliE